jgi:DNA-binding GntR family transcriptional regulator
MNPGATAERVYVALKRRILDLGYRPGERLDPARLGEELFSSVTPVRDALHILTGEALVEARASEGFHVTAIDGPALQDLYEWNAQLVLIAIRAWRSPRADMPRLEPDDADLPAATAQLFAQIARHSPNVEHLRAILSANDRLHAARHAELPVLPEMQKELAELSGLVAGGNAGELRRSINAYHRRRRRAAANIVRSLYRQG